MRNSNSDIEQFSSLFRLIIRDFQVFGRHFLSRKNLTLSQYRVLSFLVRQKESKMCSLKKYLAVTGPVVTGIVDSLYEKKLVERGRWEQDKREVHVCATSKGRALVKEIELKKKKYFGFLLGSLSSENKQNLLQILENLSKSLAEQNSAMKAGKL